MDANITTIAVLGAGTMGQGIAQVAAQAGYRVILYDPFENVLQKAEPSLREILEMLERKSRIASAEAVLSRLTLTRELERLTTAEWVIEAVPEKLELKRELFATLDTLAPKAVLATNTSTLSVTRIAAATGRPEDVIGMHFFNPAPLMALVEVIPGIATSSATTTRAVALAKSFGKHPVVAKDAPGFIVNRVARPFYGEALRLDGEGLEPTVIDTLMRALGFRMGPFELMDLIGIDVNFASTKSVYEAFFHEPRYRPHPRQKAMIDSGRLGRKSGRGFYTYPRAEPDIPQATKHEQAPNTFILGSGRLVEAFKRHFAHVCHPREAELVLDLRLPLASKTLPDALHGLPVASYVWAHSASLAVPRYQGSSAVTGISLVPPLTGRSLVELFPPLSGENRALTLARRYFSAHDLPTLSLPDTPGGVGFRVLAMLINEAISALAEGLTTPEGIDEAMKLGTHYPLGPLLWSEQLGLETILAGLSGLHDELSEPRYRPHPLLKRMVAAGLTRWSQR